MSSKLVGETEGGGVGGAGERVRDQLTVKLKLQNKKLEKRCRNQKIRVCGFKAFVSVEMKQRVVWRKRGQNRPRPPLTSMCIVILTVVVYFC